MYPFKVNACDTCCFLIFPLKCLHPVSNEPGVLVCHPFALCTIQPTGFVEVGIHYPDRAKTPAKGQHAGVAAANGKEFYFLGPLSKVHYLLSQPQQSHFFLADVSATATETLHGKL